MAAKYPVLLNNVSSTVQAGSSAIGSSSATGINVATGDGAKFGTIGTDQFIPAVIVDTSTSPETVKEYVYITAISTDALTVTRQAESSSAYPASTTTIQAAYTIAAVGTPLTLLQNIISRPRTATLWYPGTFGSTGAVGSTLTVNGTEYTGSAIVLGGGQSVDGLGVFVNVAGSAGAVVRFGLRADAGGVPGTLLVDAGTAAATTGSAYASVTFTAYKNLGNTPIIVWPVLAAQGAPATAPTCQSLSSDTLGGDIVGSSAIGGTFNNTSQYKSSTTTETGALTSTAPTWAAQGLKIWFRAA